jgi:hypothetical protein
VRASSSLNFSLSGQAAKRKSKQENVSPQLPALTGSLQALFFNLLSYIVLLYLCCVLFHYHQPAFCNFYLPVLMMGKKRRVIPTAVCNLLLVCHFIHAAACAYFLIPTFSKKRLTPIWG